MVGAGQCAKKRGQRGISQRISERGLARQDQGALLLAAWLAQCIAGVLNPHQAGVHRCVQLLTSRRQKHLAVTALEQGRLQDFFQQAHRAADCAVGEAEFLCGQRIVLQAWSRFKASRGRQ